MRPELHEEKPRRRMFSALVVCALAVSAITIAATGAIFTDSASVGPNTFTTGSVDISASPASAVVSASNMAPGDRSNGSITVSNAGSLQLRYAVQRSATNTDSKALRDALRMRVALRGIDGSCGFPYYNADGTTTTIGDDSELYEGLGFPATPTNTIGNVTQGFQSGDRPLNGGTNEVLCVSVALPSAVTGPQTATTDITLDFVAEQTTNN
jgi:spore coat-associated protein N